MTPEFSGIKGRFFAWFLTSPLRRILEWRMGNPDSRMMELLALEGTEVVVDSGCGSGHHSLMIADALTTGRVLGVDVSAEMLSKLERNAKRRGLGDRAEGILGDGLAIPLGDQSADRAVTVAAWHHMDDPDGACAEMTRVLRPGGRLVAIDLEIGAGKEFHGHHRVFGEAEMHRILDDAGLQDLHVEMRGRWVIGCGSKADQSP